MSMELNNMIIDGATYEIADKIARESTNDINKKINISSKKFVFIGDSYLQGYTPEGEVENWGKKLAKLLGLEDSQWQRIAKGGTALNITNTNNFYELMKDRSGDTNVTDVILACGYNDHQDIGTYNSINEGLIAFKNKISELYPNATLRVGFIGNTNIVNDKYGVSSKCPYYIQACQENSIIYLNNVEYALHNYYKEFASDGIHPNDLGEKVIAKALFQAITTGSAHIIRSLEPVKVAGSSFFMEQQNNAIRFLSKAYYAGGFKEPKTIKMTGANSIIMYEKFDNTLAVGCGSTNLTNGEFIPVFFVTSENKTILVDCKAIIDNGFFVLYPYALKEDGTDYLEVTLTAFQIRPFTMNMDALYN